MRNLKKILALVLALVMSLSLMMTASAATDFKDDGSIESYREAIEVLHGLGVFNGDQDGNFNPKSEITRAEVAAIIYRIATGDVTGDNKTSYSVYGNQFTDVLDEDWFAGYVSYCHNANIIKGHGDGSFGPNEPVTGYQALAMVLRAVGYDKNNEFTGDNWQINTASFATERGVLKNTAGAPLGANATRELVAEILFQSILLNKVNWNAITNSYTQSDATLAHENLGMDRIEGVVTANEWADLESNNVLAKNRTRLDVDGTSYTLNVATDLDDMGRSRYAYVKRGNAGTYDLIVDELYDTGKNANTWENEGAPVSNIASSSSLTLDANTERFVNFGEDDLYNSSDYRIRYEIDLTTVISITGGSRSDYYGLDDVSKVAGNDYVIQDSNGGTITVPTSGPQKDHVVYTKTINIGSEITSLDHDLMYEIFDRADKFHTDAGDYELGEVYVATQSVDDISDKLSFNQFWNQYVLTREQQANVRSANRGEKLTVVDNNNDGIAEFVFLTRYTLDQVTDVFTKGNVTEIIYDAFGSDKNRAVDYATHEYTAPAVDDVVIIYTIDGWTHIAKADSETVTVSGINYRSETITVGSDTKNQSRITNATILADEITDMDQDASYVVYYDFYGNIRAYEPAGEKNYGVLTEMYGGNTNNGQLIQNSVRYAELTTPEGTYSTELLVSGGSSNVFNNDAITNNWYGIAGASRNQNNTLQRAISGLGLNDADVTDRIGHGSEFFYSEENGDHTPGNTYNHEAHTWTNVAKYAISENGQSVSLNSASKYWTAKNGNQYYYRANSTGTYDRVALARGDVLASDIPVYAIDYVQLDGLAKTGTSNREWPINVNYENYSTSNKYVNATNDTEFYLVIRNAGSSPAVLHFDGTSALPAIAATRRLASGATGSNIHATYAVARNTSADNASQDYWVADVIVIEVYEYTSAYTSVITPIFTGSKQRAVSQFLESLHSETSDPYVTVVPNNQRNWPVTLRQSDFRFYELRNENKADDGYIEADITPITDNWNDYGIYAGEVIRTQDLKTYVDVDLGNGKILHKDINNAPFYYYSNQNGSNVDTESRNMSKGHKVIAVLNRSGQLAYVIDLEATSYAPSWILTEWTRIHDYQRAVPAMTLSSMYIRGTEVPLGAAGYTAATKTWAVDVTIPYADWQLATGTVTEWLVTPNTVNGTKVEVTVTENGSPYSTNALDSTTTLSGANTGASLSRTAVALSASYPLVYTIKLTAAGNTTGTPDATYVVTATCAAGDTSAELTDVYVKGVKATKADPYGDGTSANTGAYVWEVELTYDQLSNNEKVLTFGTTGASNAVRYPNWSSTLKIDGAAWSASTKDSTGKITLEGANNWMGVVVKAENGTEKFSKIVVTLKESETTTIDLDVTKAGNQTITGIADNDVLPVAVEKTFTVDRTDTNVYATTVNYAITDGETGILTPVKVDGAVVTYTLDTALLKKAAGKTLTLTVVKGAQLVEVKGTVGQVIHASVDGSEPWTALDNNTKIYIEQNGTAKIRVQSNMTATATTSSASATLSNAIIVNTAQGDSMKEYTLTVTTEDVTMSVANS